jgi:hypothetical protein
MVIFIIVRFVILIGVFFDNSLLTLFFEISWIWYIFLFNSVTVFSSALAWRVSLFWNFIWGSTSLPFQLTSLAIWFWYSTQRCPLSAFIFLRQIIISAIITCLTLIHAHYSLIRLVYRLLLLRGIWCSPKFLRLIYFLSNQFVWRAQNWLIFHWLLRRSSDCFKNIFLTRFLDFLCFWCYSGSWRLFYLGCVPTKELFYRFRVHSWILRVQGCPRDRHLCISRFLSKLHFTDFFVQLHDLLVTRLNAWF